MTDERLQELITFYGDNFSVEDFLANRDELSYKAVKELLRFRRWHGKATLISSAYRPEGAHSIGAFDQFLYDEYKENQPSVEELWRIATAWPWWGVGLYFDTTAFGKEAIMIHTDICTPAQRKRPLRWLRIDSVYWYENIATGLFYNENNNESISLEMAGHQFYGTLE